VVPNFKRFRVSAKSFQQEVFPVHHPPVMRVVGEADVLEIIEDQPDVIWNITSEYAGISKQFFDEYYQGKDNAVAYKLGKVKKYKNPLQLLDFGINFAPQSFVYI